jgi:ankyrin repeat protein
MKRIHSSTKGDAGELKEKPQKIQKLMLSSPKVHMSVGESGHTPKISRGYDDGISKSPNIQGKENTTPAPMTVDQLLWNGSIVWKVPFHTIGSCQRRLLRLRRSCESTDQSLTVKVKEDGTSKYDVEEIACPIALEVINPQIQGRNSSKCFAFDQITAIREGHQTPAFHAFMARHGHEAIPASKLCFSICLRHRSIDLYTDTENIKLTLVRAILDLKGQSASISFPQRQQSLLESSAFTRKSFFTSARSGDAGTFRWYLENGFDVDIMEDEDARDTPLIAACRLGRTDIVQIALQFDAKNDPHPHFGQTALQVAVASGYTDCVRLILETAAISFADKVIVNHEDYGKEAPLHVASRCGSIDVLKLLIYHGANTNSVDARGRTCLHCAAQYGHMNCLTFLLDLGCQSILEQRDDRGVTCLHMAVKADHVECSKLLLDNGSDIRAVTLDGKSIFNIAHRQKSRKMCRMLDNYQHCEVNPVKSEFYHCRGSQEGLKSERSTNPLDIFHGLNVYTAPQGKYSPTHSSNIMEPVSTEHSNSHYVHSEMYPISTPVEFSGSSDLRSDRYNYAHDAADSGYLESNQYPADMFRVEGETWYMFYSSEYPYFVREKDRFSQVSII